MVRVSYHASHEQYRPSDLLTYVQQAEEAGFTGAMCSDHFFPWSDQQGQSGFAWSWLGSAMQATSLTYGTVCAPGQRYNPAIIAQAATTLAEMHPERFWVALGSGQFVNEHITGERWPTKAERNERLLEAVDVIRRLWDGETVTHRGHFTVEDAELYTRAATPPMIVGAAITPETAEWVGGWADALITIAQPPEKLREMVDAFRRGGGHGKPLLLQTQLSYAPSYDEALDAAHREWGTNIHASRVLTDLRMPADFVAASAYVRPEDVAESVIVASDPREQVDRIRELIEVGFDEVLLHNVHRDQTTFVRDFGAEVLPELTR